MRALRSCDRVAEGAPLLREYVGKTCIEGSNPSGSAKLASEPSPARGFFIGKMVKTASISVQQDPQRYPSSEG